VIGSYCVRLMMSREKLSHGFSPATHCNVSSCELRRFFAAVEKLLARCEIPLRFQSNIPDLGGLFAQMESDHRVRILAAIQLSG